MSKVPVEEVLSLPSPEFIEYLKKLAEEIEKNSRTPVISGIRDRLRIIKEASRHATEDIIDPSSDIWKLFESVFNCPTLLFRSRGPKLAPQACYI